MESPPDIIFPSNEKENMPISGELIRYLTHSENIKLDSDMTTSGTSDESSDDENSDKKSSEDSEDSSDESSDETSNATDPLEDLIAAPSQSSSSFQGRMTVFLNFQNMKSFL